MAKTSPTMRSKALLQSRGYRVGITEKWNQFAGPISPTTGKPVGIRQDLFGFIDMVAIKAGSPIVAIQTTTTAHMAERIAKIEGIADAKTWLDAGGEIHVHGWTKRGVTKKRPRAVWECRELVVGRPQPAEPLLA